MMELKFDPDWDIDDFYDKGPEVDFIKCILDGYNYEITDEDAYRAWLAGNDGVWEDPMNYSDQEIVTEIVRQCAFVSESYAASDILNRPFVDEWLDAEVAAYEPKVNAKVEGFAYDDAA
jgi:hypothetical protein